MRKLLSICLSVMLVLGTMSVLFALPATASETANLIINGDGEGVGGKLVYDANDAASSSYTGEIVENQAVAWRNSSPNYADVKVYWPETINADLFNNYGGSQVLGINNWRYAYQDVEIEAGKTYRVSAKITVSPKNVSGGHYAMFIDANQQCVNPTVPSDKAWYVKHDIQSVKVDETNYADGDFKEYSFVFNADDFIAANNLSAKGNGKYHARFVMYNYSSYVVLYDDVVFQEVYDVVISAGQGGTVDTTSVALGADATIKATPYYGNSFKGWYDKNDNLVSTNATYSGIITGSLTAKFNVYNQIVDGNFESGTSVGSDALETLPTFADKEVVTLTNPVNLNAGHGNNALYVTTDGGTATSVQYTVKVPLTVKKNTQYVFAYSYYAPTQDGADYNAKVVLHSEKNFKNAWTPSAVVKQWSFVWNVEGANGTFPGPAKWTYNGDVNTGIIMHSHTSVGGGPDKWVDVIYTFDSGESDTIFAAGEDTANVWLSIGMSKNGDSGTKDASPNFYLDNMSFTEATNTAANKLSVSGSTGGSVAIAEQIKYPGVTYYYTTGGATKGDAVDTHKVAGSDTYANMMSTVKYTATANEGYAFLGWYDANDVLVSTNATESFYTEGSYVAKFEATMGATDGGYVVDNGNGSKTAVAYFGNLFDAWYDSNNEVIQRTETIDANTYPNAVARFYKHNQAADGGFDDDADSTMYIGAGASGEVLTDTDGNKFLRLTHVGTAANYVSFSWPFSVEKGKKYIVSFKIREGLDAEGNKLSSSDISFRKQIRPMNAAGTNYDWTGLKFAEQEYYVFSTKQNTYNSNCDLLPSGGTALNPSVVGNSTDHMLRYAKTDTDWVSFSYIIDASSLTNVAGNTNYFASSNTANVGLILGANAAGTMVLDIDEVLISEVKEEYGISMTDPIGGHITVDRIASTEALPVTYTAFPDTDGNYSFDGWYDSTNTRVSISATYTPSKATTLTAQFKMDNLGFETTENGFVTANPYYGNAFDGWYDAATGKTLQSTEKTVSTADAANWVAKYKKGGNLLHDGAFEDTNSAAVYDAYFDYHIGSVKEIVPTYVPNSGPEFGNYCLQVTPRQVTNNGKIKGLLNIPVDVEAGKTYLWKFSYAITTGSYTQDRDFLYFSVDEASPTGTVTWQPEDGVNNVDYSFHFEKHSVDMSTNGWTWGAVTTPAGSKQTPWSRDYKFSAINEWMDVYVLFTPVESGKHFLSMGTTAQQTNLYVFDNMSLSAVEANKTPTSVVAEANGTVSSYRTNDPAYFITGAVAGDDISTSGRVDFNNAYYSDFYATYYAVADLGYTFDGWYKDGFKVSSDKEITLKTVDGGSYVAKFELDNNKYYANAETEAVNGVYGGYLTGTTSYNELLNGETATFTAVAYNGNTFKGWYNKATGKLLSTEATYTHVAKENVTLVAKFNIENKFNDSGYENTALDADIWGEGKEWYATVPSGNYDATINAAFKYNGNNALNIYAPNATVRHSAMDVEANATYHLSFYWRGSSATIAPSYVKVYNAADMTEIASFDAFNASADKSWQKFYINFNTGAATSVIVELKYAEEGSIYFDDLALFNAANANFTVNTTLEKQEDIFPGYIATEKTIVSAFGSSVTVTAVPYEMNTFLGWYENGVLVSDQASFTFTLECNYDLVAKFSVRNIVPDSGAENTETGVSLSHGKYNDWVVNESQYVQWGFDVTALDTPNAFDGKVVLSAMHRTTNYSTTFKGLKENTNYVFSFWWNFNQGGTFDTAVVNGVQTGKELARGMGGTADGTWQQVIIPFYTEQNTEITLTFKYTAGSGACMMDNFALYESDFVGVYAAEGGTVTSTLNGGENGPADRGEQVTVTATPDAGHTFKGWYNYNNLQEVLSTDLTYTFTVTGPKYVIAYFEGPNAEEMNYFVDGDFENNCFEGVIFSHPFYTVEWCSYTVVKSNSDGSIRPVSGEKMMTMSSQSRMANIHIQNLTPNADYTLSFYYNADPGASVDTIRINRYLNESDDRLDQEDPKHPHQTSWMLNMSVADYVSTYCLNVALLKGANSGQWRRAELSFNAGNRGEILMSIGMGRSIGSGAIYFDDVRLTEGNTQSDNQLGNGNFEDASNTKGWDGDFTTATEGGNTYGVSSGEISNAFFMDYANAHSSTITFKAKSNNGAVLGYGMTSAGALSLFDANGVNNATSNTSYATVALTNEWTEYSINVANNGLESYKFFLKSMNGGEFMVDDASIKIAQERIDVEKFTFEADTYTHIDKNASVLHAQNEVNDEYFQVTNAVSKNGSASLMMTNASLKGNEYKAHKLAMDWATLALFSGRRYTISFWAKAENVGDEFRVHSYVTDDDWGRPDLLNKKVVAETTDWTYYTFEFTNINLNAAPRTVKVGVGDTDKVNNGNIYFDDFTVSEASTVVTGEASKLYTEDISQNYFKNPSFEKADSLTDDYVKNGDAFYGDKYITVKAGDKIVIPVNTKPDFEVKYWKGDYTFAASVRGNANANGYIGVSFTPDGSDLMTDKDGNEALLSVNTNGKWARSGFNFTDYRWTYLYLVIECTAGSFDVDYISMFNQLRSFKENPQLVDTTVEFTDYEDMSALNKGNYIGGNITGLPEGSYVVLVGDKTLYAAIDNETGRYDIENIPNDTYAMMVAPGGAAFMTEWGDLVVTDEGISGLACERLNGSVTEISGQGVRNGIVKIIDDDSGWAYFTTTGADGMYTAYILECSWYIAGTTKDPEVIKDYKLDLEAFTFNTKNASVNAATVTGESAPLSSDRSLPIAAVITVMLSAAALIVLTFKKGECK